MLAKASTLLAVASPVPTAIGGAGQFCAVVARIAVATIARGRVVPVEDALPLHQTRALFQRSVLFVIPSRTHGGGALGTCKGVDTFANGHLGTRIQDTFTSSAARFPIRTDGATQPTKRSDEAPLTFTFVVWTAHTMATT